MIGLKLRLTGVYDKFKAETYILSKTLHYEIWFPMSFNGKCLQKVVLLSYQDHYGITH